MCYAAEFLSRVWTATLTEEAAASEDADDGTAGSFSAASLQNAESSNGSGAASAPAAGKGTGRVGARPIPSKRTGWTPEHRKNLSEAIKAKWREPEYRMKIIEHMRDPSCQDKRVESRRVRLDGYSLSQGLGSCHQALSRN